MNNMGNKVINTGHESFNDITVKSDKDYYKRLAWFLDRSAMFLRDKPNQRIVILKNLKPGTFLVEVLDPKSGEKYLTNINNVEPVIK